MRGLFSILLCVLFSTAISQEQSRFPKFGKVTIEDLNQKVYAIDSNANAVVLSDINNTLIDGNSKGWFSTYIKRHRVVHILNKNGYNEANVEIPLYSDGSSEEKLDNIKAITYNLENGKIVESKLEKSAIFREKVSANRVIVKFTMPNVKEGCIIEFEYKVISDYISTLDTWYFQDNSPILWSELNLSVPEFFGYSFLGHGYQPMWINENKTRSGSFTITDTRGAGASDRTSFNANVTDHRWAMKDIPAWKPESYTSSYKNHVASIDCQLVSHMYPLQPRDFRSTWPGLIRGLSEEEAFGAHLKKDNNWLSDDLKPLLAAAPTNEEKARVVYNHVRDNYSCTGRGGIYMGQTLKNVAKSKKGSVSEINLLLTAMLRYAGLEANPVILSTKDHGYALEMYPMISNFNYVVAQVSLGDHVIYLDGSLPRLGFGKLTPDCYNGHARVVDDRATPVVLSADSLKEKKLLNLFVMNNDKGEWAGRMIHNAGYYESYMIRRKVKENGLESVFEDIKKNMGNEFVLSQKSIDSLDRLDDPITIRYDFTVDKNEDILYINPLMGQVTKTNPFVSAERTYPVEMPYVMDQTILVTMEVPAGYEVDELPKQMAAKLDEEGSAYFEYRLTHSGNLISLRTKILFNRTLFLPDEYTALREFYNLVVKKQNEQIVFKKKK